jgi:Domain of unknown function (DUF4258)
MANRRETPDDPSRFIKRCLGERKIFWTYHVNMRLRGRYISREQILDAIESFEIIEEYPKDKYLSSYLIYAESEGSPIHILVAVDVPIENIRIVTAYHPSSKEWEKDYRRRRQLK